MVRPQHQPLSIVLLFFSLLLVPGMVGEAAAARLSPPANLTVPATDADGKYVLSWTAAATLEGGLTYVLQEASDSAFTGARTILFTTEVSATINGRKSGRTYYYRVRATKSGRKASPWAPGSNGCQVTILAAAPGPLTVPVTDADGSYVVSWEPSATPGVTYVLKEATDSAFTKARTVPHTALLSADISGRKVGRNYYYRVRAIRNGRTASTWTTGGNGCQIVVAPSSVLFPLNDTGITWYCGASENNLTTPPPGFEGQDADHGRDRLAADGVLVKQGAGEAGFDFTKLDGNGNDLPAEAANWSCVRDNHTGLIWEEKSDDGGLRDQDWTYSWYDSDPNTNGGSVGYLDPYGGCGRLLAHCNTEAYVAAVNQAGLCGASDWRLPKRQELQSIVHQGRVRPSIDTTYFPHTPSWNPWGNFWSSSPYAYGSDNAWFVNFSFGGFYSGSRYDDYSVRLVRGGE